MKKYIHNEFQQLGTNYNSVDEVAQYDDRMRQFRDIDSENRHLSQLAKISPGNVALEIGTGTGAWARHAARHCKQVDAIDISPIMLEYAAARAHSENLENISFIHAGFLSYQYPVEKYDAIVSSLAMHHLSDVWKAVALRKIFNALKPGRSFVLADVVFDWGTEDPEDYFDRILAYASGSEDEFARHISEELSTQNWIMSGLLENAGFVIESFEKQHEFMIFYQCRKPAHETKTKYRFMRCGEEHQVCALAEQVFNEFVAPGYDEEGIKEFFKFANPQAMIKRFGTEQIVIVAERQSRIVGMIEMRQCNHIAMLFVDERGSGIGKTLVERAIAECCRRKPETDRIMVNSSPYAEDFYARVGFEATGERQKKNGIIYKPMSKILSDISNGPV